MLRTLLIAAVFLALPVIPAAAQHHNDGWFVPGYRHIHYVDSLGTVTSLPFSTSYVYSAIMNWDNKTVLTFDYSQNAIMQVDPKTLTVLGTLIKDSRLTSTSSVADMAFDSNGDLFVSGTSGIQGIYKTSMTNPALTLAANSGPIASGAGNMSLDPDTGELLVTPNFTAARDLYLYHRDGSTFSTVGNGFYTRYGTYKHILTGDIYSGSCCGKNGGGSGAALIKLAAGTTTATTLFPNATVRGGYSPWPDRASAATQRLVLATWMESATTGGNGLWLVDIANTTMTKLATITTGNTFKAVHVFGRNLQTVNIGKGKWAVRVSFPGMQGLNYAVALSLSGVRPFITIPDGRHIPIVPDDFMVLSLTTGLAPFFTRNIGTLNASAEGTAVIDLSMVGKAVNGFVFYLLPAVLDPRAPFGISIIGDPRPLVIEGL